MNKAFCTLVSLASLPGRIYNRMLNAAASGFSRGRIVVDWRDARIIGADKLKLQGSFNAGRGLWLQAIGDAAKIEFGDGAMLSDWVHIGAVGRIHIGRDVLIGSKVIVIDHSHGQLGQEHQRERHIAPARRPLSSRGEICIGDNVWLGDNVVVLGGARIGDGCVVGANSVVSGELPAGAICAGNPARVLRPA
jgi:acetyltransferase-like isoleucine patch superfamily enzyme